MYDPDPRRENRLPAAPRDAASGRQQHLMLGALVLLLVTLGIVLYTNRDFWFPDSQVVMDDDDAAPATSAQNPSAIPAPASHAAHAAKKTHASKARSQDPAPATPDPPPFTAVRTVLPPLDVEVVAGNVPSKANPHPNSVRVDMQSATPAQAAVNAPAAAPSADTAAAITSNAADRVQMSTATAQVVTHTVRPGYPLLARQMKVQGSVILQALINKDGSIDDLHVLSGSPILANAAQEAVKQWRFKPHYEGAEAVETEARITVNFTISTN
jgi:periplasmic protein TonB